ncbi:hypothetical protein FQR65_LT15075 [Abscondita terminalis]|nr:hypothetical protein FQR65_LT15075 [Abscondita terminalis]
MWEPLVINNRNYLLKCKSGLLVEVFITNFKEIWVERLSQEDILNRFQQLNPLFDCTDLERLELVEYIVSMIKNVNGDVSISLIESDGITIEFTCKWLETEIKFFFNVEKGDENLYFNEFTLSLIQSVQYLEMRQKKLFELIEQKDKEILEHVLENGEITRKVLVTEKFERDNIMDGVPEELIINTFGKSKHFFNTFSQNYGAIKFNSIR